MISDLIKKYEGCKLQSYICPAGVPTIGWGNTFYKDGSKVKLGQTITQQQADELLDWYIKENVLPIFNELSSTLNDSQKQAICSLIYNWNIAGFKSSKLFQAIKSNDMINIYKEWDYGVKNNLLGLFKRRSEELYLYFKDIK